MSLRGFAGGAGVCGSLMRDERGMRSCPYSKQSVMALDRMALPRLDCSGRSKCNVDPLLTMEDSPRCYVIWERRLVARFPCNAAGFSARCTPPLKDPEAPRKTPDLSPEPSPKGAATVVDCGNRGSLRPGLPRSADSPRRLSARPPRLSTTRDPDLRRDSCVAEVHPLAGSARDDRRLWPRAKPQNMVICSALRDETAFGNHVRDERVTGWKAGGRMRQNRQRKMPICRMFSTGATGLEPATSGVTGRSWRFREERG
jgi:hypothetical protein